MSASIAPHSVGLGIGALADRQPQPRRDGRQPPRRSAAAAAVAPVAVETLGPAGAQGGLPSPFPEGALPADTLFNVALIANRLPLRPANVEELHLQMPQEWVPPASDFRLTDKKI